MCVFVWNSKRACLCLCYFDISIPLFRNCIGMNFALSEIRVSVASILRRFRISLDPEKPLKMCLRILLKTEDGLWLKLQEI